MGRKKSMSGAMNGVRQTVQAGGRISRQVMPHVQTENQHARARKAVMRRVEAGNRVRSMIKGEATRSIGATAADPRGRRVDVIVPKRRRR